MKTLTRILAITGAASIALAGCSGGGGTADNGGGSTEGKDFKACAVSDAGGWDDKSFNESAYEGLKAAEKNLGVKINTAESSSDADFQPNVDSMISDGCNLIIGVGFKLEQALHHSAEENKDLHFALVDSGFVDDQNQSVNLENGRPLVFNTAEAAFLAGYAAAGMTKTGKVATFGGIQIPSVSVFMDGFADGVDAYNKAKGTSVQLLGWDKASQNGSFTQSFDDQALGKQQAQQFIDQGADIIMPVAGPVGQGTLSSVRQKNDAGGTNAVIWVDSDGYTSTSDGSIIMTSVVKEIGNSVYDTVKDASEGRFSADPYIGTLKNKGVTAAPFHDFDSRVPDPVKTRLEELRTQITNGTLDVSTPYDPS